ncbi:TetR/AcrR family transcriptional regulator [Quadrisphaera sp. DSM 44207]|uniref:TetR/AcrR family transcriptional regulator n=1 Tax=Quadrisphaera sp. DSM 44207 TaxID=1881057 RepID=UPI00088A3581|nr:TetR/AcrR family transcriptional regulator [Quadrisphaera sp. DSM 44207]SDQ17206.1 transcriptional regulator, TetR family [Quadrisphaera sp. DSM 44207]
MALASAAAGGPAAAAASPRERILAAAAHLLAAGGREAVTTRAVSAAADVQAPTIYRQFGDMRGLLDAVASRGFAAYLRSKADRERLADPVEDLRAGWDLHVDFGLANPALYALMYGDPRPGGGGQAAEEARAVLHQLVQRAAEAGRLRVGVEPAARMIGAAGVGVVLTLLAAPERHRDLALSRATREAVLAAVTTAPGAGAPEGPEEERERTSTRAVALRAALGRAPGGLTAAEHALLLEWLDRITAQP